MQNFNVLSAIDKQSQKTGKSYKALEVSGADGNHKVNIFPDFPDYANIKAGSVILGQIEKNGQYENFVSATKARGNGGAFKEASIQKNMERKEQGILLSQENKEWGIRTSSTIRMAVDLTIAMSPEQREDTLEETIRKWRSWLWTEWDVNPKDKPPF